MTLLAQSRNVVLDYTFWSKKSRDEYEALVDSSGATWELIYPSLDEESVRERLRLRRLQPAANHVTVTAEVLADYLEKFEPPDGEERSSSGSPSVGMLGGCDAACC